MLRTSKNRVVTAARPGGRPALGAPGLASCGQASVLVLVLVLAGGCRVHQPGTTDDATDDIAADTTAGAAASATADSAAEAERAANAAPGQIASQDGRASRADPGASAPVRVSYEPVLGSFAERIAAYRGAVVNLRTTRKVKSGPASLYPGAPLDESLGSGFVVGRGGAILTDLRLVARVGELRVVTADGEEYPAAVVGTDPHTQIALLRAEGLPAQTPILELDDSEALAVGQWVMALGSPFAGEVTAHPGIITGLGKRREIANPPQQKYRGFLHTSAAIHAGNSGGPLVDMHGRVVGISHALAPGGSPLGFAVPASAVAAVIARLESGGTVERAWLGMRFLPVNRARAEAAGLAVGDTAGEAPGAYVSEVLPGHPADRAGLRVGDILLRFAGNPVDADNLPGLLRRVGPDRQVAIVMWRDGKEIPADLTTGRMQD
ncbi:MAG: trypsin-like peptidase domain-containing protein [Myxococcota bacterium]